MNINYYEEQNFNLTEIGVVMEDVSYTKAAKINIPAIMPGISDTKAFSTIKSKYHTNNIINKSGRANIRSCTISNYVSLKIPVYIGKSIADGGSIKKGTKFIISFVGGEINKPRVIGVYDQ